MDYTKLYYFYTVARYNHVTKAAEEIHIAQPALTKAIHALEEEIGVKLFAKRGRNIVLTVEGEYLKSRLDAIVPRMERLDEDMKRYARKAGESVRINVLAASTVITEAVVAYRKMHTDVEFHLIQNETETDCHITVATLPLTGYIEEQGKNYAVYREPIYLAVPTDSVYASMDSVDLSQVAEEAFVSLAGSRGFRNVCDSICRTAGFQPRTTFESDSILSVQNFIGAALGVGFWPAFTWGSEARFGIRRIPIRKPRCFRLLTLRLHEDHEPTKAAKDFYRFLKELFEGKTVEAEQNLLFREQVDI